ncbi:MAG TPA: hypothetical protein VGD98_17495, partial [Ktedonobacteraceae bacterium]
VRSRTKKSRETFLKAQAEALFSKVEFKKLFMDKKRNRQESYLVNSSAKSKIQAGFMLLLAFCGRYYHKYIVS